MDDQRRIVGSAMHRIRTTDPVDDDFSDLAPLGDLIGGARVVALGESMHRVHEFLALRDRVFRFLSREHGVTAIAIESGFAEGLVVQRWIDGDDEEPFEDVLRHGMTYHFGACEESALLVETMRGSGSGSRFHGLDVGAGGAGGTRIIREILRLLDIVDPGYAAVVRGRVLPLYDYLPPDDGGIAWAAPALHAYLALPEEHRHALTAAIARIASRIDALWPQYAESAGDEAAWTLRRLADTARLGDGFLTAMIERQAGGVTPSSTRDALMARTVEALLERHERVLVVAANGHIQRSPMLAPPFVTEPFPTMGAHLAASLGADYVPVATTFGSGEVWLHRPGPDSRPGHSVPFTDWIDAATPRSLDALLAAPAIPVGILGWRGLPDDAPLAGLLDATGSTMNGDGEILSAPRTAFDGAIHVDHVTPWRTWLADGG
ncbi:erythromycin esterase family protein [Microbacterium rhizophilus]|uniref:erythromycin esterase family protein n=1 Tax=Microbacterium rhizophilus TaxID=3138934 RepID=UPI0031ECE44D